jgi:hypothetical protein
MDQDKVVAIMQRRPPRNVKEIQEFLGCTGFYRKFIKDYAKMAKPLVMLIAKDTKFVWGDLQNKSFEDLKQALVSFPVLRSPDMSKVFFIKTDASLHAIGAILGQRDENKSEYVVCYASRILKNAEVHYGISKRECLAVIWAIKQFRPYVYGTKFEVITDNSALKWLMESKDVAHTYARWALFIQEYNIVFHHRSGNKHADADALSRPVLEVNFNSQFDYDEKEQTDPYENECLMHVLKFGKFPDGVARKVVNKINKLRVYFKFENNKLF